MTLTSVSAANSGYFGKHFMIGYELRASHSFINFNPGTTLPYLENRITILPILASKGTLIMQYGFMSNFNFTQELKAANFTFSSASSTSHNFVLAYRNFGRNICPVGKYSQVGIKFILENNSVTNVSGNPPLLSSTFFPCLNFAYGRTYSIKNKLLFDWAVEINIPFPNTNLTYAENAPGNANIFRQLFSLRFGLLGPLF